MSLTWTFARYFELEHRRKLEPRTRSRENKICVAARLLMSSLGVSSDEESGISDLSAADRDLVNYGSAWQRGLGIFWLLRRVEEISTIVTSRRARFLRATATPYRYRKWGFEDDGTARTRVKSQLDYGSRAPLTSPRCILRRDAAIKRQFVIIVMRPSVSWPRMIVLLV